MTDEQQCEKFETTQRKLREAELFLGHLIENEQQLPSGRLDQKAQDVFGFYLSAYLSAAYSVVQVLCAEIGQDRTKKFWAWYSTWIGERTFAERKLFPPIREAARKRKDRRKKSGSFMEGQRHAEVHKHGADMRTVWTMVPISKLRPSERGHPAYGFHVWSGVPGTEPPKVGQNVHYFNVDGEDSEVVAVCTQHLELLKKLVQEFAETHP